MLMIVAKSRDAVLTPTIGTAARVVMRQVIPCTAPGTIVLPYRSPLALGEIRPPPAPILFARSVLSLSMFLGGSPRGSIVCECWRWFYRHVNFLFTGNFIR